MDEQPPILALKFVAMRERERRAKNARVIQRLWRRVKRNEQASADAKVRILNMLTSMPSRLRQQQETQQQTIKIVHDVSSSATRLFIHRAAQRLAARLIQRVWRGHCARKRARRLREWRLRKFLRRRQRDRLRDARTALLMPSEVEQRYRKELETRTLARQQETPLLPVPRRDDGRHYQRRRGERATLLEPLPLQSRPPQISSTTRTKVQCVPFSRFEKIIAQDARVNLRNVWVAIPVGHHEQQEETSSRHGGLSPLLVGKGRKREARAACAQPTTGCQRIYYRVKRRGRWLEFVGDNELQVRQWPRTSWSFNIHLPSKLLIQTTLTLRSPTRNSAELIHTSERR